MSGEEKANAILSVVIIAAVVNLWDNVSHILLLLAMLIGFLMAMHFVVSKYTVCKNKLLSCAKEAYKTLRHGWYAV